MRRAALATLLGIGIGLSGLATPTHAHAEPAKSGAPTKAQCIDANTQAQTLRVAGRFSASREALKMCASPSCPQIIRTDCTQRIDELARAQPSIVIEAKDETGADLSAVQVFVGGTKVADRVGADPVLVDPGEYDLRFVTEGAPEVTHHVIVREGDQMRREAVLFKRGNAAPAVVAPVTTVATTTTTDSTSSATSDGSRGAGQRTAAIAVGAAGVGLAVTGFIFGSFASSTNDVSTKDCSTGRCPDHAGAEHEHTVATNQALVSTIGVIAGGAGIAGGLVLYFTAPKSRPGDSAPSASLSLAPAPSGAVLRGTF